MSRGLESEVLNKKSRMRSIWNEVHGMRNLLDADEKSIE